MADESLDKKIADYCRNNSWRDAAMIFDCSKEFVHESCRKHEVIPKGKPAIERQLIAKWVLEESASLDEAITKFSCSDQRVKRACLENKVQLREKETAVVSPTFEILRMLIEGGSDKDVAKAKGVTRQRVNGVRKKAEEYNLLGSNSIIRLKAD